MKWNSRDWVSAATGWVAAIAVALVLPDHPLKFFAIFGTGFIWTLAIRSLIPRA